MRSSNPKGRVSWVPRFLFDKDGELKVDDIIKTKSGTRLLVQKFEDDGYIMVIEL